MAAASGCSDARSALAGEAQQLGLVVPVGGDDVGEGGLANGQGAGLVEGDDVECADALERGGVLDQDPVASADPGPHGHRGWRCESEGVGAGDDHGADRERQRGQEALVGRDGPDGERDQAGGHRDDHQHRGGAVGQPLPWGLGALGGLDQRDDLAERGVGADLGRLHDDAARAVDRSAHDLVALGLVDRDRLAGDQALIDGELPDMTRRRPAPCRPAAAGCGRPQRSPPWAPRAPRRRAAPWPSVARCRKAPSGCRSCPCGSSSPSSGRRARRSRAWWRRRRTSPGRRWSGGHWPATPRARRSRPAPTCSAPGGAVTWRRRR